MGAYHCGAPCPFRGGARECRSVRRARHPASAPPRRRRRRRLAGEIAWNAEQAALAEATGEQLAEDKSSPTGARPQASALGAPAKVAPRQVVPHWDNLTLSIYTDSPVARVPETFLATSHEWDRLTDYADNLEAFTEIFKQFGPSPILRMGGASQDAMTEVPKPEIWWAAAPPPRVSRVGRTLSVARSAAAPAAACGRPVGSSEAFYGPPTEHRRLPASPLDAFAPSQRPFPSGRPWPSSTRPSTRASSSACRCGAPTASRSRAA
jgi:hypothetical protein